MLLAGRIADHVFLRDAHAQQATDRQVTATLTQSAGTSAVADPYSSVQTTWARGPVDGTERDGPLRPGPGHGRRRCGQPTVRIWVNASGAATDPPAGAKDVMAEVAVTVMVTGTSLILVRARRGGTRLPQPGPPAVRCLGRGMAGDRAAVVRSPHLTTCLFPAHFLGL